MRFAYSIKQKIRIAMLLFAVMACTILIRVLEDKSVKSMNASFVSMYNDRLIPATDLFYVAENAFAKISLLEEALYISDVVEAVVLKEKTALFNSKIDSLIKKYEKTLLVKKEKELLADLKNRLLVNSEVENKILNETGRDVAAARNLYEQIGRTSAAKTIQKLSELMGVQTQVGQDLLKDSEFMVSGSKVYSAFQVGLAIVIGILIVGIVFTSNVVDIRNDKFNLN